MKLTAPPTLLFCVTVTLFSALVYPHHLHYQEQYQLFLFDSTYAWEVIKLPGGVADLAGRFCTQFFLFAWIGAFIIALLLSAIQLLTFSLASWGKLFGLSFVPSFLLWLFLLDENALLGGAWAVLLTLLASWLLDKLSYGWTRNIMLAAAIPLLYWISGPVSLLFPLLQATRPKHPAWHYGLFILWLFMPILLSFVIPVHSSSLWYGIHYHRYPTEIPYLLWAATLSIFLLTLPIRLFPNMASISSRYSINLISFVAVAVCMGGLVWKNSNIKAEKTMQYDFMACHQQWNRILETIDKEKPNNQIGVTVQNLALAMRGTLVQQLFSYNQNGMLGLLPDVQRDATSPMPTAEAFYQLGMVYIAQRTVFEAQEAILDFQKSARCYKRLAQTNLINGNYEVARKYLFALQKTIFYKDWADETMMLLGNEKAINQHPEYGRLRKFAYNANFYFDDHTTTDMLKDLYLSNTDNSLAYQYMLASFMLTGDRDSFYKFTQNR